MSDDLAAFFAKKTKGGKKKKGVIELKEISEQLERKAMEQKDEGEDAENKPVDEGNNASRNRQPDNNAEDSEWLEFDDTPNISVAIREMVDDEHEADSDGKRASVEPIRTWNLHIDESEEPADDKSPATVKKETKYVVRGAQREKAPPLDLGNEEMFPSIEKAPEVEQKLKVLDEERRRAEVEERKRKEDEQKRLEEEQARRGKMYKAPRGADAGAAGGEGNSRTPVPADEVSSWRSKAEPTPSPAPTQPAADGEPRKERMYKAPRGADAGAAGGEGNSRTPAPADEVSSWRSKAEGKMYKAPRGADAGAAGGEGNSRTPVPADEVSSWRSKAEPTPSPAPTQPAADGEPRKSKYVPPHMRKQ